MPNDSEPPVIDPDEEDRVFEKLSAADLEEITPQEPPPEPDPGSQPTDEGEPRVALNADDLEDLPTPEPAQIPRPPPPEPPQEHDFGFLPTDNVENPGLLRPTETGSWYSAGWTKIGLLVVAIITVVALWSVNDNDVSVSSTIASVNSEEKTDLADNKTVVTATETQPFTAQPIRAYDPEELEQLIKVGVVFTEEDHAPNGSIRDYLANHVLPAYKDMRGEQKRLAAEIEHLKHRTVLIVGSITVSLLFFILMCVLRKHRYSVLPQLPGPPPLQDDD